LSGGTPIHRGLGTTRTLQLSLAARLAGCRPEIERSFADERYRRLLERRPKNVYCGGLARGRDSVSMFLERRTRLRSFLEPRLPLLARDPVCRWTKPEAVREGRSGRRKALQRSCHVRGCRR
jgi:hypothetical protein